MENTITLIKEALVDLKAGKLALFSFAVIVDSLLNKAELTKEELKWGELIIEEYKKNLVHNPHNVPADKLGEGYRFLDKDEVGEHFDEEIAEIEGLMHFNENHLTLTWTGDGIGSNPKQTYRTKLTKEELKIKRDSKKI